MAGLMSGLTLGLMSLDQVDLEVGVRTRVTTQDQVKETQLSTVRAHTHNSCRF